MLQLKIPPLAQVLIWALLMWGAANITPALQIDFTGRYIVAFVLAGLGAVIIVIAGFAFRRRGTTVNPYTPDQTRELIIEGLYRWTRNPMYLGMLLTLAGWALWLANIGTLLALPLFMLAMNHSQILPEERALIEKFGTQYREYQQKVRRWL